MTDIDAVQPSRPACPWCSADLPSSAATVCPSCGATLIGDPESPLPGVTAIDAEAIVRATRSPTPQRRNKLMSWITGEEEGEDETPAPPGSLEPPAPEVQREMLRMQLEAELTELQAEAEALAAQAREEGLVEDAETLEAAADTAAEAADEVAAADEDISPVAGPSADEARPAV